ncbi:hypothetical protein CQA76_08995, partial [Campylobacter aviculae]
ESLFFNSYVVEDAAKAKPATDIFNNNNGGKENINSGVFFDTTPSKYRNPDGTITKGGLLVAIVNANLYTREGEATPSGKAEGFDKSMSGEEVRKAWEFKGLSPNLIDFTGATLDLTKMDIYVNTNNQNNKDFNYKDPISEMFEDMEKFQKEQLERLEKQRKAKRL